MLLLALACNRAPDSAAQVELGDSDWDTLGERVEAAVQDEEVESYAGIEVYRLSDGELLYSHFAGDGDRDTQVAVASASKWVSSTLALSVVQAGSIGLDDRVGQHLDWSGEKGDITLRQLMSFSSGLDLHLCVYNVFSDPESCVAKIYDQELTATPGSSFVYGPQHMAVMGEMLRSVTGLNWAELFEQRMREPLGLDPDTRYYAIPEKERGADNPLIAGGLRISAGDYALILKALLVGGFLEPEWVSEQGSEQWAAGTEITSSPYEELDKDYHYALGCWRECASPSDSAACDQDLIVSSAGAFGFTPWVDRDAGYFAVYATKYEDLGGALLSAPIVEELRVLIPEIDSID